METKLYEKIKNRYVMVKNSDIKSEIPAYARYILTRLENSGYEAVIIGGCVRDYLLRSNPNDWDIATSATPEVVQEIFKDERMVLDGLKHGTVTVIMDHEAYEITTYREDGKYTDFRRPDEVNFVTDLEKDVMRRDFTINSIAYDIKNDSFIDYAEGISDIMDNLIRCVGDPNDRFQEDPLRILRAVRFCAQFGFEIEKETEKAMFENAHLLRKIATERLTKELTKTIMADHIDKIVKYKNILDYAIGGIATISDKDLSFSFGVCKLCKTFNERLSIIIDNFDVDWYNDSNIDVFLKLGMKLPNKVVNSVKSILRGKNEIYSSSVYNVLSMLSKYDADDVRSIINIKIAKINYAKFFVKGMATYLNGYVQCDLATKEFRYKLNRILESTDKRYVYRVKQLDISGYDIKNLGYTDSDIGRILNKLLDLVMSGQVKNEKPYLVAAIKLSEL